MCIKFGFLREDQVRNKAAVASAIGKLLRAGKIALLERDQAKRRI